jgi:tetratricopeptide (TPR) repeat protein
MLTLRIRQDAGPTAGTYRVQAELDDDGLVQAADTLVTFELDRQDARDIRWYLEDYLEYPLDPAPQIAARIEGRMAELGRDLFASAFPPGSDARDLWSTVRDRLSEARVEVITDVRHATAIPWELLRDPRTDTPVALRARSFVRGYRQGAQRPRLPRIAPAGQGSAGAPDGDSEIRILLVICRPGGRADVPFRSVAGQLVRMYPRVRQVCRLRVLRPATFEALGRELRAAAERGEPYHVVHFDGHGTWADLSGAALGGGGGELSPLRYAARGGPHGYLLFEDPDADDNVEYVDGVRLGSLLAETQVPLLVLNACRSAHAEVADTPAEAEAEEQAMAAAGGRPAPVDDPHARVRAYGSLAQEIVDAGVAGVVAMRYNVYVVTATQFIAEMYQNLLSGSELGQAVTRGRKNLADNPMREIAFERLSLQDWPVPVVYEVAPLRLFPPSARPLTLDALLPDSSGRSARDSLPNAPDTGFYGRDETLLAIDRAMDSNQIVLLHAFAGSGKTTTAVEFARWYQATGGLDDQETGEGAVVFTSFELHKPLSSVLNDLWEVLARRLPPGESDRWMGLSLDERRELALRLLDLLPVLWIWDNVEPVTGFPAGTPSAWGDGEIAELAGFLRDLRRTKAKVILTSRREEQELLGGLPTRISLRALTMPDRFQLARAVAERSGQRLTALADWRPLLRFSDGNPLTMTVLVREALRSGVRSASDVERFVERVRSGAGDIEDDESQGRSRSLGASLSYGVAEAFSPRERPVLAMLHLFQRTVEGRWLKAMLRGVEQSPAGNVFAEFAEEDVGRVLGKAAEVGLLDRVSGDNFIIHPALPWYFQRLFAEVFGPPDGLAARAVTAAYVDCLAEDAGTFDGLVYSSIAAKILPRATLHEANFLNARALAISEGEFDKAGFLMTALQLVYESTTRDSELARLADELAPLIVDQGTGLPTQALELTFLKITEIRARAARRAGRFDDAERLIRLSLNVSERHAAAARAAPGAKRHLEAIASLGVDYMQLGLMLFHALRPDCVEYYEKALAIFRETGSTTHIARAAGNLANVYLGVLPELRNLDRADEWLSVAIEHYKDDPVGRGKCLAQRGAVKRLIAMELIEARGDEDTIIRVLQEAADALNAAFSLLAENPREMVTVHEYAGRLYQVAGQYDQAVSHFMLSLKLAEQNGQLAATVPVRIAMAETLAQVGRTADAVLFAEQAFQDAQRTGAPHRAEAARNLLDQIRASQGGS